MTEWLFYLELVTGFVLFLALEQLSYSNRGFRIRQLLPCYLLESAAFAGFFVLSRSVPAAFAFAASAGVLAAPDSMIRLHELDLNLFATLAGTAFCLGWRHPLASSVLLAEYLFLHFVFVQKAWRRFGELGVLSLLGMSAGALVLESWQTWSLILIVCALVLWIVSLAAARHQTRPLLLFDLDGTLIDSQQLVFETFKRVFKIKKPGYPLSQNELYSFFGPTLETSFSKYFPKEEVPEVIDLYQKINLDLHRDYLKEMPNALSTVRSLREQGYTLGIVSNKRKKPVLLGLEQSGLAPYFSFVFGKEDLPAGKPEPDGLILAARTAGYPIDNTVYVGDNSSDIKAAKRAGMFSAGYTLDKTQRQALEKEKPSAVIDDLRQLSDLFGRNELWIDKSIW